MVRGNVGQGAPGGGAIPQESGGKLAIVSLLLIVSCPFDCGASVSTLRRSSGIGYSRTKDQCDSEVGEMQLSYSFVNLEFNGFACPDYVSYHNCGVMRSV